jgi:hypothetical protein
VIAQAYYDNATKLLRIKSQPFVGMITVGLSAIGVTTPRTPSSFLPEFEKQLPSDGTRLPIKDFAAKLGQFFLEQWHSSMPPDGDFQDMIFFVAGYDETDVYGKAYRVDIPNRPDPVEILHDFGLQSKDFGKVQNYL